MQDKYNLFILLAFISEVIGTVSGFGSSLLFVPIASIFFDFKSVLAITAIFHIFSNISKIILFRKGIQKNIALKLGIPAIISVILGALLTSYIPSKQMELIMNIILILFAIYLIIKFNKTLQQKDSNLYIGGAFSGFLAGIAGTGGAIRGITLSAFNLPKEIFIATSSIIDLGVDISRGIIYISNDYFKKDFLILLPFLIAVGFIGSATGKLILKYITEKIFKYIVLVIVVCTSIFQIVKYFL